VVASHDIYPTLLQAAGLTVEKNIDGQDLQRLLTGEKLLPRTLTHEIGSLGLFNYSVLSADGQWRASPNELYALSTDATGATNVIRKFPVQAQKMEQEYNDWRNTKTRLAPQYTAITAQGQAQISGDDFLRAPGYGAFSVAIGAIMPDQYFSGSLYLISQKNIWSLIFNADNTFTVQIGNNRMTSKPLMGEPLAKKRDDQCVPIVLSSWYTRSRLHEGSNTAYVKLYAGSEKLLDWQTPNPAEINADWSAPTWIGRNDQGGNRWPAALGTPQFYNTALIDASLPENTDVPFDHLQDAQKTACQFAVKH